MVIPDLQLQVISDAGGLGDQLARLAALREVLLLTPELKITWFAPDYMAPLIERTVDLLPYLQTGRLVSKTFTEMRATPIDRTIPGVQFSKRTQSPGRLTLFEDALLTIADSTNHVNGVPTNQDYVTVDSSDQLDTCMLGDVVVVATGYTTLTRAWPVEEINKFIAYLLSIDKVPMLLGKAGGDTVLPEGINTQGCIDMRNTTTLLETLRILELNTEAIVGVDNGLFHLAGCAALPPKVIAGYTSVSPRYRAIMKNGKNIIANIVVPKTSLECRYCQSKYNTLFNYDFRDCLNEGTFVCTTDMTSDKFVEAYNGEKSF